MNQRTENLTLRRKAAKGDLVSAGTQGRPLKFVIKARKPAVPNIGNVFVQRFRAGRWSKLVTDSVEEFIVPRAQTSLASQTTLLQAEADRLLQLPKEFDPSHDNIEFRRSAFRERYDLFEINGRERFLLDLERSQIRTATLKFQTQARTVFILARSGVQSLPTIQTTIV